MFRRVTQLNSANCEPVYEEVRWLEYVYPHCTQIFAASFGREKICQIHLRTGRCKTLHGERWPRARGDDRVVNSSTTAPISAATE